MSTELRVGSAVAGVITGVQAYGAFVRITGVGKDGLLHAREAGMAEDMRERYAVGERLEQLFIKAIEGNKFTLTTRDPNQLSRARLRPWRRRRSESAQ